MCQFARVHVGIGTVHLPCRAVWTLHTSLCKVPEVAGGYIVSRYRLRDTPHQSQHHLQASHAA